MNKIDYLKSLEGKLEIINRQERKKFIVYYEEMIEDYKENGYTEAEAIENIGDIDKIADEILEGYEAPKEKVSRGNKLIVTIAIILGFPLWGSIVLTIVLLIFSLYLVVCCLPLVVGVATIGFFAMSVVSVIGSVFVMLENVPLGIVQIGAGILSLGVSLLLLPVTIALSRKIGAVTKKITNEIYRVYHKGLVKL